MGRKYDIKICSCGHIHAIPVEKIDTAVNNDKDLLLICGHCGAATLIGADVITSSNKKRYMMYNRDFSSHESSSIGKDIFDGTETQKAVQEIFYSHGYGVPMKTGYNATDYMDGVFYDNSYPLIYEIQRNDITPEEIFSYFAEYDHKRSTVNMGMFIRLTPDDVLQELSGYLIDGLDWSGTKYERN